MLGVEHHGQNNVKTAIDRHQAMVCEDQTDGCLPWQNVTEQYPRTHRKRKNTGALPPRRAPTRPGTLPVPSDDTERSATEGVQPGYMNIHTSLLRAQFFNWDPYAKDRMLDEDFIPHLLSHDGPSTG
jgi:hypothetical protein